MKLGEYIEHLQKLYEKYGDVTVVQIYTIGSTPMDYQFYNADITLKPRYSEKCIIKKKNDNDSVEPAVIVNP